MTAAFDHPSIATAIRKFVYATMQKGVSGARMEHTALRNCPDIMAKVPIDSTTATKFRYRDVACTQRSRVSLTFLPNYGDFIHANWLRNELMDNAFIATQGPLEGTSGGFLSGRIYKDHMF